MKRCGAARRAWLAATLRAIAAFAAFLVAGDHGLASLHQALTVHETCAEHGELVHAGSTGRAAEAPSSVPAVDRGTGVEEEHHHCGAVPAAPTRAPVASGSSELATASLDGCVTSAVHVEAHPAADVLAFAPKQSPPV
jgi:hypothetical protein